MSQCAGSGGQPDLTDPATSAWSGPCPVCGVIIRRMTDDGGVLLVHDEPPEEVCHYCGQPLLRQDWAARLGPPKRRMENNHWHWLHAACAGVWDKERGRT